MPVCSMSPSAVFHSMHFSSHRSNMNQSNLPSSIQLHMPCARASSSSSTIATGEIRVHVSAPLESGGLIKTTITGLSSDLKPTLQHFNRAFGTSGRIVEIDSRTSDAGVAAIQLCGDHRKNVRDTLLRWGVRGSKKALKVEVRRPYASAA
jgi:translation initiation factor 1 (eIF-1/SUI1)